MLKVIIDFDGTLTAEVALAVPTRLLRLFAGAGVLDEVALAELTAAADLPGAVALQAGAMADMDRVAELITAD